jgi:hypothetical protein
MSCLEPLLPSPPLLVMYRLDGLSTGAIVVVVMVRSGGCDVLAVTVGGHGWCHFVTI